MENGQNSLIWSEREMKKFYTTVLEPMNEDGIFEREGSSLLFLSSRKNYYPEGVREFIRSANFIRREILRDIGTPTGWEEFRRKVKRLDFAEGSYTTRLIRKNRPYITDDDISELRERDPVSLGYLSYHGLRRTKLFVDGEYVEGYIIDIPLQTCVVYVTLTVHNTIKAVDDLVGKILSMKNEMGNIALNTVNGELSEGQIKSILSIVRTFKKANIEFLSALHRRTIRKPYIILDIDYDDYEFMGRVVKLVADKYGVEPLTITRTHGGYHVIYSRKQQPNIEVSKNKAKNLVTVFNDAFVNKWSETRKELGIDVEDRVVEVKKDPMTSVPGTFHGGVKVRMIEPEEFL